MPGLIQFVTRLRLLFTFSYDFQLLSPPSLKTQLHSNLKVKESRSETQRLLFTARQTRRRCRAGGEFAGQSRRRVLGTDKCHHAKWLHLSSWFCADRPDDTRYNEQEQHLRTNHSNSDLATLHHCKKWRRFCRFDLRKQQQRRHEPQGEET